MEVERSEPEVQTFGAAASPNVQDDMGMMRYLFEFLFFFHFIYKNLKKKATKKFNKC